MKRWGAVVSVCVLAIVLCMPLLFVGRARASEAQANTTPVLADYIRTTYAEYLRDNHGAPANAQSLQILYGDSYRRAFEEGGGGLTLTQMNMQGRTGLIHVAGEWQQQGIARHYGDFGGIVGTSGGFSLQLTGVERPVSGRGLATVEFHAPLAQGTNLTNPATQLNSWESRTVNLETNPEDNRDVGFGIEFDRVGIYRVTIRTRVGSDHFYNVFWILIRNRHWGEIGWRVETRFANSVGQLLNNPNISIPNPPNVSSWTLGIWSSFTGNHAYMPTINIGGGTVPGVDNLTIVDGAGVDVLRNEDSTLNVFSVARPSGVLNRLVITLLEDEEGEPIELEHQTFTIRVRVTVNFNTMTQNAVSEAINDSSWFESRMTFREPVVHIGRGFPWLTLVISLAVLATLGGSLAGINWMINNSQDNYTARMSKKARQIAQVEEKNFEHLRKNLVQEYEKEQAEIEIWRAAFEISEELERERQGDSPTPTEA